MPGVTARDLKAFQSGDVRVFVQRYAANPLNNYDYWGRYSVEDGGMRSRGEPERVRAASDERRRSWITVDTVVKDTETQTLTLNGTADRDLKEPIHEMFETDEEFTVQIVIGVGTSPQSLSEWDSKLICTYSHFVESNPLAEAANVADGDDNASIPLEASVFFDDTMIINKLTFAQVATGLTLREILDSQSRFVSPQYGYRWYMLSTNTPATNPSAVILGKGRRTITWSTINPTPLSTAGKCDRLYIIGEYLVLTRSEAASLSHLYALLSDVDAGTNNYTSVTGYTATKGPVAMFARSVADIIVVGLGGYIYNLTGPTSTPAVVDAGSVTAQNLNDVHGFGRVVIAVGASNAFVKSSDGGLTFSSVTGPNVGVALNAVWCLSDTEYYVGSADGKLHFTEDGGTTWTLISMDSDIDEIHQIRFVNRHVGYIAAEASAATVKGRVYRTTDAGVTWQKGAPSLNNALTTPVDINTVTAPSVNKVLGAGIGASNGIAALAQ